MIARRINLTDGIENEGHHPYNDFLECWVAGRLGASRSLADVTLVPHSGAHGPNEICIVFCKK